MECFSCIIHFLFWQVFPRVVCWNRCLFTAKWMSQPWEICVPLFIVHINAQVPLVSLCISFFLSPLHMAPQQEYSFICVQVWNRFKRIYTDNRFNIFVLSGHALHLNHGPHLGGVPVWMENNVFFSILINIWWKLLTPQRNLPSRVEVHPVLSTDLNFSPALQQLLSGQLCWHFSVVNIFMSMLSARNDDHLKTIWAYNGLWLQL